MMTEYRVNREALAEMFRISEEMGLYDEGASNPVMYTPTTPQKWEIAHRLRTEQLAMVRKALRELDNECVAGCWPVSDRVRNLVRQALLASS